MVARRQLHAARLAQRLVRVQIPDPVLRPQQQLRHAHAQHCHRLAPAGQQQMDALALRHPRAHNGVEQVRKRVQLRRREDIRQLGFHRL